jgi:hypothetical protein
MLRFKAAAPPSHFGVRDLPEACFRSLASLLCCFAMHGAQAARPMATDDTATAPAG